MPIMTRQAFTALLLAAPLALTGLAAQAADVPVTPAPEGAKVYIISPGNGAIVPQTFTVRFGLKAMGVAPAGVANPKAGHHHLLIDKAELPPAGQPMGQDVKHFGGGQTEAEITLPPGPHTLQLIMGDMNHVPFDPPVVSEKITVNVQ
jgi:hypothetical protein